MADDLEKMLNQVRGARVEIERRQRKIIEAQEEFMAQTQEALDAVENIIKERWGRSNAQ